MRLIVGIELAISVVDRLLLLQEELSEPLRQFDVDPRWTPGHQLRINVRVVEEIDEGALPQARERLHTVAAAQAPFRVDTFGTTLLPSVEVPRMLMVGTHTGAAEVEGLHRKVSAALATVGVPDEARVYAPWVLVGRFTTSRGEPRLQGVVSPYERTAYGTTYVRELVLYRSDLVGASSRIRVVDRLELGRR